MKLINAKLVEHSEKLNNEDFIFSLYGGDIEGTFDELIYIALKIKRFFIYLKNKKTGILKEIYICEYEVLQDCIQIKVDIHGIINEKYIENNRDVSNIIIIDQNGKIHEFEHL
jgi:hypothetical protein